GGGWAGGPGGGRAGDPSSTLADAAQSQSLGRAVRLVDLSAGGRRREHLEYPPMRVGPANYGHHVARRTAHVDGSRGQRRAAGSTGTDAVARPPVLRGGGGVPQSRHDRPEAGTDRDDLDEGPRPAQRPPVGFED